MWRKFVANNGAPARWSGCRIILDVSRNFTEPLREQLRGWLRQRPDSTLVELQEKLAHEKQLQVSVPALWSVLGKMGLRLKKSHSTRASGIRKPTSSSGKRFSKPWLGARRKS